MCQCTFSIYFLDKLLQFTTATPLHTTTRTAATTRTTKSPTTTTTATQKLTTTIQPLATSTSTFATTTVAHWSHWGTWLCSYFGNLCFKTRTRECSSVGCAGASSEVVQDCSTGCGSTLLSSRHLSSLYYFV